MAILAMLMIATVATADRTLLQSAFHLSGPLATLHIVYGVD